jgi:hypothetical protein
MLQVDIELLEASPIITVEYRHATVCTPVPMQMAYTSHALWRKAEDSTGTQIRTPAHES